MTIKMSKQTSMTTDVAVSRKYACYSTMNVSLGSTVCTNKLISAMTFSGVFCAIVFIDEYGWNRSRGDSIC